MYVCVCVCVCMCVHVYAYAMRHAVRSKPGARAHQKQDPSRLGIWKIDRTQSINCRSWSVPQTILIYIFPSFLFVSKLTTFA
ncbi:hypothetical protein F4811DRAFT_515114 [Daldinia bambusicola]|nr:hypothetical protein F4811DRAFT_515114 [Daldinia bambusicola]